MNPATTSSPYPPESRKILIPSPTRKLALAWLMITLTALVSAGISTILAVISQFSWFSDFFPTPNFSRSVAIVQFDQSVVISFLSFGGILWSLGEREITFLHRLALVFAAFGCLAVSFSPFAGFSEPFLNNYLPILLHPLFMAGIILFGVGIFFQVILSLRQAGMKTTWKQPARLAAFTAAFTTLVAILSLIWTWFHLTGWKGQTYFEFFFLGSGQVIQFAYIQLMVMAWMGLAAGLGVTLRVSLRVIQGLLILGTLPIFLVPLHYARYLVDSPEAGHAFMTLMRHGGGILAIPMGIVIFHGLIKRLSAISSDEQPLYIALCASLFFFMLGGILGWVTSTLNTIIPAHHHAFTVGVSIALMGLIYHLLTLFNFAPPLPRLAIIQPWVYIVGKSIYLIGLIASGSLGVQHKIAGIIPKASDFGTEMMIKIVEFGDFIAAIGLILFVVAVLQALNHPRASRW